MKFNLLALFESGYWGARIDMHTHMLTCKGMEVYD
jgi:hypothetical protein